MDSTEILKICTKCGKPKSVDQFYWRDKSTGLRRSDCKECVNQHHKEYYRKCNDYIKKRNKLYRENNKESKTKYDKKYYQKNKKKILERKKQYGKTTD